MSKDIKEIANKKQIRWGWIAFIFIVSHFTIVILSILPANLTNETISKYSNAYTDPIFDQRWAMFAPCPTTESKLLVKYYFENDSTGWINPISETLVKHQTYRFTYHGNIAVGYSNMLGFLQKKLSHLNIGTSTNIDMSDIETQHSDKIAKPRFYIVGLNSKTDKLINPFTLRDLKFSNENRQLRFYIFGYANEYLKRLPVKAKLNISYTNIITNKTDNYYFTNYR